VTDDVDHVRQSACLSLPALCRRIEDREHRRWFAVESMTHLIDSSEDVRCAALEMLGEIVYIFQKDEEGPPVELLQIYMDDTQMESGPDCDWDMVAAFNVSGAWALLMQAPRCLPDAWT
jgi:serine/threonine-protein phosphatase 4 regulatory subunit 1